MAVERLRRTVVAGPLGEESVILGLHLVLDGIEGSRGDGVDLSGNIEEGVLRARRRRERALIRPAVVEVDSVEKLADDVTEVCLLLLVQVDPFV